MLKLRDIMTRDVISVAPDTPLAEVAQLLAVEGISGVPVAGGGRLLGVISTSDIIDFSATDMADSSASGEPAWDGVDDDDAFDTSRLGFYFDAVTGQRVDDAEVARFPASADVYGEYTASDVMTRAVFSLGSDTPVEAAGRFMLDHGIHRVVVVDGGALVGIVTSMDFVRVMAGGADAAAARGSAPVRQAT